MQKGNFGIVVSGGPAPGINSAIASIVIEASNRGYHTKGLENGFKAASLGQDNCIVDLLIETVTPQASLGGSILGTSRFNPFSEKRNEQNLLNALESHGIDKLVTIGGEGSAYLTYRLSKLSPKLKVVHLPKTIDNDLILPNNYPSFGFETALFAGTNILKILAVDAKTTNRWFLVTSMGRKSGSLALGLGLAGAITLTLIPEEFENRSITPDAVASIIFESMIKRARSGKRFGVAVLAEGIVDKLDLSSVDELKNCPRDELGRIKYAEVSLEELITRSLRKLLDQHKMDLKISTKDIGFELRCHDPISFDIEYTRFLGHGAVECLLRGTSGVMVARDFDKLSCIPLETMMDERGRIKSRSVDINSDLYRVARSYMIR